MKVQRQAWWIPLVCAALALAALALARPPRRGETPLRTRLMAFLNRTLGWQGLSGIKILSIAPPGPSGLRAAKVELSKGAQHADQTFYITPNERYILLGELSPLSGDPWRDNREKLRPGHSPSEGVATAPVTIYEFSDLECPYCRQENGRLQRLVQNMPGQVRVIFKYYPLVKIHPWSMQAAIAAACVTQHNPNNFWPFEQAVFDHQDELDVSNVAQRLRDFAMDSATPGAFYDTCVQSVAPKEEVEKTLAQGHAVGVKSTPTLYMNGRPIDG
ncbi:MAG: thioredoxin domain-containing protein, partial [Terriglobales bacterium]